VRSTSADLPLKPVTVPTLMLPWDEEELGCGALAVAAGARPRLELSVTLQEGAKDL